MASYDAGLVALYTAQYSTNLELLLQQKGSKLRGHVNSGSYKGKMASIINQIAPITAKKPTGRFTPKQNTQSDFQRPWVFPSWYDVNQLLDPLDELQTIVDPKSGYVQNAANAMGRAIDDEILAATTAAMKLGVDASSLADQNFDTTNHRIAVDFDASGNTGLTVAKLLELKRVFTHWHNDLDSDPATIIIGSKQEQDLLKQQQIVSSEYNDRPVLVSGKLSNFLGFNIEVMERVPETTAGSVRGVVAFVQSGMHLGLWQEMENRVSIRNDLTSEPWQLYTKMGLGATRTQAGKVIQILCADTTGADINP